MKGYVRVPQFWYYAKSLDDLDGAKGDAASYVGLCGRPILVLRAEQPACSCGEIIFRVEDDDRLTLVAAQYDSSG